MRNPTPADAARHAATPDRRYYPDAGEIRAATKRPNSATRAHWIACAPPTDVRRPALLVTPVSRSEIAVQIALRASSHAHGSV